MSSTAHRPPAAAAAAVASSELVPAGSTAATRPAVETGNQAQLGDQPGLGQGPVRQVQQEHPQHSSSGRGAEHLSHDDRDGSADSGDSDPARLGDLRAKAGQGDQGRHQSRDQHRAEDPTCAPVLQQDRSQHRQAQPDGQIPAQQDPGGKGGEIHTPGC